MYISQIFLRDQWAKRSKVYVKYFLISAHAQKREQTKDNVVVLSLLVTLDSTVVHVFEVLCGHVCRRHVLLFQARHRRSLQQLDLLFWVFIMKRATYLAIVEQIRAQRVWDSWEIQAALEANFPQENQQALASIVCTEYTERARERHRDIVSRKDILYEEFTNLLKQGQAPKEGLVVAMARRENFSAMQLMKFFLEKYVRESSGDEAHRDDVNRMLKKLSLIPDRRLAAEARKARVFDQHYGFYAEGIKTAKGWEGEQKLRLALRRLKIDYKDEAKLREEQHYKTPDFLLNVPIKVDGQAVNWIESKGLFGDEKTHADYITKQLFEYHHLYGTGLVIYWDGFVDEISKFNQFAGIMVRDSFPADESIFTVRNFPPLNWEAECAEEDGARRERRAEKSKEALDNALNEIQRLNL